MSREQARKHRKHLTIVVALLYLWLSHVVSRLLLVLAQLLQASLLCSADQGFAGLEKGETLGASIP